MKLIVTEDVISNSKIVYNTTVGILMILLFSSDFCK